jgi:hypothetical protein
MKFANATNINRKSGVAWKMLSNNPSSSIPPNSPWCQNRASNKKEGEVPHDGD